jgi:hypothetical protein
MFKGPNENRIRIGELASNDDAGNNGAFLIDYQSFTLRVIASDGMGWEHVSEAVLKILTPVVSVIDESC